MPTHCGTSDVREVLGVGSATEFNVGSADVINKIEDVDLLIDERLALYDLSVSGTAEDLIVSASKYMSAALYLNDFYVRREENGNVEGGQSKTWWSMGSTFLYTYITKQTEEYNIKSTRMKRMWSTTTENP